LKNNIDYAKDLMIENVDKIIEREMQVEILVKKAGSLEQ
jgi:hypothetical protein